MAKEKYLAKMLIWSVPFLLLLAIIFITVSDVAFYFYKVAGYEAPPLIAWLYKLTQGNTSLDTPFLTSLGKNYAQPILVDFLVLCMATTVFLLTRSSKNNVRPAYHTSEQSISRTKSILLWFVILFFVSVVIGRRYLTIPHPVGTDTPVFVGELMTWQYIGFGSSAFTSLSVSGLFYPLVLIGLTAEQAVMLMPLILSILACVIVFWFVKASGIGGKYTPYVASAFLMLSISFMRSTADLFHSLFAYSVILAMFIASVKFLIVKSKRSQVMCALIVTLLSAYCVILYAIAWLIYACTWFLFMMVSLAIERNKSLLLKEIELLLPTIIFILAGLVVRPYALDRYINGLLSSLPTPSNYPWVLVKQQYYDSILISIAAEPSSLVVWVLAFFNILFPHDYTDWRIYVDSIQVEQTIVVALSILALLFLSRKAYKNHEIRSRLFAQLLIVYCDVLGIVFLVTHVYRSLLFIPFSIFVAIFISIAYNRGKRAVLHQSTMVRQSIVKRSNHSNRLPKVTIALVFILLGTVMFSNVMYYDNTSVEVSTYPDPMANNILQWIVTHSGSNSVVICSDFNGTSNWVLGIVPPRQYRGDSLYWGNVTTFINDIPSKPSGLPLSDPSFFEVVHSEYLSGLTKVYVVNHWCYTISNEDIPYLSLVYLSGGYGLYQLKVVYPGYANNQK